MGKCYIITLRESTNTAEGTLKSGMFNCRADLTLFTYFRTVFLYP
jgi:hypothetical protein